MTKCISNKHIYMYEMFFLSPPGVTVVLTMCFMNIDNKRDVPKVSYSTALDYYVGGSFTFVLATIIQFAGVHYFTKHGSGEINHDSDSEDEVDDKRGVRVGHTKLQFVITI